MNTNNSRNKGAKSTSKLDQPPSNITDLAKSLGKRVLYLIGSAILFESLQNVKQIYDIKCIDQPHMHPSSKHVRIHPIDDRDQSETETD